MIEIICGDVRHLPALGPFHAVLCDPPYHLTEPRSLDSFGAALKNGRTADEKRRRRGGFMGKLWDGGGVAFDPDTWAAILDVLHPGAFGMAFGGSRTYHRLACAIEDAGAELHPLIYGWAYGSGFPKATRIDTQVDRAAGAEREVVGVKVDADGRSRGTEPHSATEYERKTCYGQDHRTGAEIKTITAPATPLAAAWEGHRYGKQALKPAVEPICCFQRPYEGRPVDCITETGAGSLWVDGGRVGIDDSDREIVDKRSGASAGAQHGIYQKGAGYRPVGEKFTNHTSGQIGRAHV